jgi:hypothetical protein
LRAIEEQAVHEALEQRVRHDQTALSLHLEVAVSDPSRLLVECDLENYLTPLFGRRWLDPARFVLVSAEKRVGGSSRLSIGTVSNLQLTDDWCRLQCTPSGTTDSKEWKESIRAGLESSGAAMLPPGPVEAHFAFKCSSRKNWITPWKPAGDALGPVLGYVNPANPYHPLDDRIVGIAFHRNIDDAFDNRVDVGIYWRSALAGAGVSTATMPATPRTAP